MKKAHNFKLIEENKNANDVEGDKRGLSTFTTPEEAILKSDATKALKISVRKLRQQGLTVDYKGTHVSIRPATQKELEEWANTRPRLNSGGASHSNTAKVRFSIVGEVKK